MDNQQVTREQKFEKFTWTIKNFSKLNTKKLYSDTFFIGGYPWRILIFPKGNNADYLSIYLDAGELSNLPKDWSRFQIFKLSLINQVNGEMTITKDYEHEFNASGSDWGSETFIPLSELRNSSSGFIVNDSCMVEVEIAVRNPIEHVNHSDQEVNNKPSVCSEPIEQVCNPLPEDFSLASYGDQLVDFKSFGKIEGAFVPLLEEVCSWHSSLIDCQQKRSRRYKEWAFTALGRVLHFLKTRKVKDMNEDACSHLQILWEELETFKFDLTWLQPHIEFALSVKSYIEKVEQLKTMKEKVAALDMETKLLEEKLFSASVDLEIATRDLAKESFKDKDLDVELGYGGP